MIYFSFTLHAVTYVKALFPSPLFTGATGANTSVGAPVVAAPGVAQSGSP